MTTLTLIFALPLLSAIALAFVPRKLAILMRMSLLLAAANGAYAQGSLTLNGGDIYIYQFDSLSLQGIFPSGTPEGRIDGHFVAGSFLPGGSILFEMFEDSTNTVPIASQILNSPVNPINLPPPPGPRLSSVNAWQDLQGVVRVTMLNGSVTMDSFQVATIRNEVDTWTSYGVSALPVPEPNSVGLLIVGVAVTLFWVKTRGN